MKIINKKGILPKKFRIAVILNEDKKIIIHYNNEYMFSIGLQSIDKHNTMWLSLDSDIVELIKKVVIKNNVWYYI